jgi:hypothetical protein
MLFFFFFFFIPFLSFAFPTSKIASVALVLDRRQTRRTAGQEPSNQSTCTTLLWPPQAHANALMSNRRRQPTTTSTWSILEISAHPRPMKTVLEMYTWPGWLVLLVPYPLVFQLLDRRWWQIDRGRQHPGKATNAYACVQGRNQAGDSTLLPCAPLFFCLPYDQHQAAYDP